MPQTAETDKTPAQTSADEPRLAEAVTEPGPGAPTPAEAAHANTRERILDVALDLFIAQGFDGTSLRQIAEALGVTKAALYYHFESKDDILLALHLRLHAFGREALLQMAEGTVTLELWGELLDGLVGQMLDQRKIFLFHERNQAALEKLHREDHDAEHEDFQNKFRQVLADKAVPFADRVRMAASIGVVFSGLVLSGEAFADDSNDDLGEQLRSIIHNVLFG